METQMKQKEKQILEEAKKIRNKEVSRKIVVKKKKFYKLWCSGGIGGIVYKLVKQAFPECEKMSVGDDPSNTRYALVKGRIAGKKVAFDASQMNEDFGRILDLFDIQSQNMEKIYIKVYIQFPLVYEVTVKPSDYYQGS